MDDCTVAQVEAVDARYAARLEHNLEALFADS